MEWLPKNVRLLCTRQIGSADRVEGSMCGPVSFLSLPSLASNAGSYLGSQVFVETVPLVCGRQGIYRIVTNPVREDAKVRVCTQE